MNLCLWSFMEHLLHHNAIWCGVWIVSCECGLHTCIHLKNDFIIIIIALFHPTKLKRQLNKEMMCIPMRDFFKA